MGEVIRFPRARRHARASRGQRSGRSSERGTPVSRSIGSTNSAGTPFLERVSQYQTCDCVVPIRSAKGFCPPATSHARLSASVDMPGRYPNLGELQPKSLSGTGYLHFGSLPPMRRVDKKAFAGRVRARIEALQTSTSAVAKAMGIKQQTLDNVVQGKVGRPGFIVELARALSTTTDWLLFEEGPEEVVSPFSAEALLSKVQELRPDQRGLAIRFIETLIYGDSRAAS